ncbi:MAG: preprotein translocase subunit SecE [Sandaracinaceae bacterium]|nr:preprotein translocase subunit SecE [Sandaracinaceae bacterium]
MEREDDEDRENDEELVEAKTLGLERWVQFAFVAIAGLAFFIGDKLITYLYGLVATIGSRNHWFSLPSPDGTWITIGAAVLGLLVGYGLYRHPKVRPMADEVAGELSKVTWPSRPETWRNTVVVIVTSLIAAAYLFLFDSVWSAFTDLIYGT